MKWLRRRRPEPDTPIHWDIKITSAATDDEGPLVHIDTEVLRFIWKYGQRSTDGYLDLLAGYRGGVHVWMKPSGWVEPDSRITQLDGTEALPEGYRQ